MHDLIVVSDLHMGRGRNPETGRYHILETFFYDEDLRRFCQTACTDATARGTFLRLIFNGDTFDLLRMEPEAELQVTRREQKFGADRTPRVAALQVEQILAGHLLFIETFADILAGGHEIVMLPGNHDLEVQWEPVQAVIRQAVRRQLIARGHRELESAELRLRFEPWFWHETGRVWVEHGCQYDPECAFRYPLRSGVMSELNDDGRILERDMPLGNFIQRYLYNGFGPITFIVPSTRANARYSRWMLLNEPRLFFRVLTSHVPFIFQVLRRLAQKQGEKRRLLQDAHEQELDALVKKHALAETLRKIDASKTIHGDLVQAVRQQGLEALRMAVVGLTVAFASAGIWFSGFLAINEMGSGFGLKSLLFLILNFVLMTSVGIGSITMLLRSAPPPGVSPLRTGAQKLVELVDVPVVTFGHTHDEVIWRLKRPSGEAGWYYNTGTWIAVFTDDVLLPRERIQYTFLRMRGNDEELLHWSPGRREALPVVLLDEVNQEQAPAAAPAIAPA
jgi:UDP-2,3-diacylglucosamine pyrophosphatase LpxH